MPFVRVDNLNFAYERIGDGPPLLLIAGFGCDRSFWKRHQVEPFAERYEVIIYDNRGIGDSDLSPVPYDMCRLTEDAVELLDALNIDRAHVVAPSMGGMIALELAIRYPLQVRSLMLSGSAARSDGWIVAKQRFYARLAEIVSSEADFNEIKAQFNALFLFSPPFYEDPAALDRYLDLARLSAPPMEAFLAQSQAIAAFDVRAELHRIACPTLLLVGEDDMVIPRRFSEELATLIPGAELEVLPGVGHLITHEAPEVFNERVMAFLKSVE